MADLLQIKYNVRWCKNQYCNCHPETAIKYILDNNKEIKLFLTEEKIYDDLYEVCINYEPITVFDMKYTIN